MRLTKSVCKECVAAEDVRDGAGMVRGPCPWRSGVRGTEDDDVLWSEGRVICPIGNGFRSTKTIPEDCLREKKQTAFALKALWVEDEKPE